MPFDIEPYLTYIVLLLGLCYALDHALHYLRVKQGADMQVKPRFDWVFIPARSFFILLLIVWGIRSFVVQPYRVPTGSLEPTIMPGDFLLSNQFTYGVRLPVSHYKLIALSQPKRGDIVLFRWPVNPHVTFIKRVVGLPGDHVQYHNKVLSINGKTATQSPANDQTAPTPTILKHEQLNGVLHDILINPETSPYEDFEVTVPPNHYFMMGDNRDNSNDSRYWGFVPEENLVGKALLVWMSWDKEHYRIRFNRMGTIIH